MRIAIRRPVVAGAKRPRQQVIMWFRISCAMARYTEDSSYLYYKAGSQNISNLYIMADA